MGIYRREKVRLLLEEEEPTTLHITYRNNCEERCCSSSHKQFKTLFNDYMVRLKIISLYIYKELSLKILGLMSHVSITARMAT